METRTVYEIPQGVKDEVIAYLEKHHPTVFWDRNAEITVNQMNDIITKEDGMQSFEEELWDQNMDYQFDLEEETLKDAINSLSDEEKLQLIDPAEGIEDADDINWNEYLMDLRDEFLDYLCVDMDIKGLIRLSRDQVFFYSTGIDLYGWGNETQDIKDVKKALRIPIRDKTWDKEIRELVCNASYGGSLCIAFCAGLEEWMYDESKPKTIYFDHPHLVIVDHLNGSGHDVSLPRFSITMPFVKDNLYLDEAVKYSYTSDICGMVRNWCDDTYFQVGYQKSKKKIPVSSIAAHNAQQEKYDETFKKGFCTFGDQDIKRHRNTYYENNFPCGTHCPSCGQFWID